MYQGTLTSFQAMLSNTMPSSIIIDKAIQGPGRTARVVCQAFADQTNAPLDCTCDTGKLPLSHSHAAPALITCALGSTGTHAETES